MNKTKKTIVILGIIILPLIYSLFYLKAFWNPYANLENIPIALVNLDKCEQNCKGSELVKNLKEKDVFDFKEVSKEEADKGLIDKDYYAVITIPEDFTSSFEKASSEDRQPTAITFAANKKTNYLAYQIIGNAINQVEETLNSEANKTIVKELTDNLQSVPEQTKQISNGFNALNDGTKKLSNGSFELYGGLSKLNTGYKAFDTGIDKLSGGTNTLYNSYNKFNEAIVTLDNGVKTLNEGVSKAGALVDASNKLNEAGKQLKSGMNEYNTNSVNAYKDANMAYRAILEYVKNHPEALNDANFQVAYAVADGYIKSNGLNTLESTSNYINQNISLFADNLNNFNNNVNSLTTLTNGVNTLSSSMSLLKDNSNKILSGIDEIKQGLNELDNNSKTISNGLSTVSNGAFTLNNGLNTLDSSIVKAQEDLDNKITETDNEVKKLSGLDKYAAKPVTIKEKAYGDYDEYGIFFSPYFMSLSLWVGGVLILMGLYYDPDQRFKVLGRKSSNRVLRLVFYNIIGIIQAIMLGLILKVCLGFEVTNYVLYYGSCILISLSFLAIIMFLFFNFKDVGKFLALVLLVIQLATCGGTFPIETVPDVFKAIYPFIPMTYSVDLLRESFVSMNSSFITKDITILITYFVVFTALIVITGYIKNKKEKENTN